MARAEGREQYGETTSVVNRARYSRGLVKAQVGQQQAWDRTRYKAMKEGKQVQNPFKTRQRIEGIQADRTYKEVSKVVYIV
jgi:hypothetical protein